MLEIHGDYEKRDMPQEFWNVFDGWYGGKSYRYAELVEHMYQVAAKCLAEKIRNAPYREFDNDHFNHPEDAYYSGQDDAADYIDPDKVGILNEMEEGT